MKFCHIYKGKVEVDKTTNNVGQLHVKYVKIKSKCPFRNIETNETFEDKFEQLEVTCLESSPNEVLPNDVLSNKVSPNEVCQMKLNQMKFCQMKFRQIKSK